jgi:signal transduction histidine kinase
MVFHLWVLMMVLVLLAVAFMWIAQVFLFSQNYLNAAVYDVENKIQGLRPGLAKSDLANDPGLLFSLGLSVNGKLLIINNHGELIGAYSAGHPLDLKNDSSIKTAWTSVQNSDFYSKALMREPFTEQKTFGGTFTWLFIGIPIRYDGHDAYAILNHSLSDIYTVLDVNRRQLIVLSVLLTMVASGLAALFSRKFTKPIFSIKTAVDELAKGDLTAKPGLKRKDELGQLSDSVDVLGQVLQRVDVLRREVIANVSHELRSPLALIGGYAEMVRDITWRDDEKRNENLKLIISESKRMTEMVNDIMDYSQLQAGYHTLKKDVYNLYEIVETEVMNCEKTAREYTIYLNFDSTCTDIPVLLDALKISQVIRNLLYNAINHTEDGRTITVKIANVVNGVRVSVINPGEEILKEERELIWERYQRSQHQGGRKQGTGIGLSIVSTLLKSHGMPYGVNCYDGLTVFWFECPEDMLKTG